MESKGYTEINWAESTDLKESPENKIKQYKIVAALFFTLFVACLVLFICAILLKLGCNISKDPTKGAVSAADIRFLLVSDIHLDLNYNQSISSDSLCRTLVNKDAKEAAFDAPYGRVNCDIPYSLLDSSLKFMRNITARESGIDFFLLTGDNVAHDVEKSKGLNGTWEEKVLKNIKAVSDGVGKAFPDLPVLPLFGNHDLPKDNTLPQGKEFYEKVLNMWQPLILCRKCSTNVTSENELRKTFLMGGYYKVEIKRAKLTLLQVNSNYWVSSSISGQPLMVANAQMKWLGDQLELARTSGNRVIISGHIPIGIFGGVGSRNYWIQNYTQIYIELVTKTYRDIVIGQLYAHTHFDDMRVQLLNDKAGDVIDDKSSFLLTNPSITPIMHNNPGFRIFEFNTGKRMLTDYHQYYMDLVLSTQMKMPTWLFDYSFSDKYMSHLPEDERVITGKLVSQIVDSFVNRTNENKHWQTYIQHRQVNYQPDPYSRYVLYCAAKHVTKAAFDDCVAKHPVTGG